MANSPDFVNHVCELLASAGTVRTGRMFSGNGFYLDGLHMAIAIRDELYLKTDALTKAAFDAEACVPFTFEKGGETIETRYRRAPDEAMDAPHLMRPWARLALETAVRAQSTKAAKSVLKPTSKKKASKKTAAKKSTRPSTKKRKKLA